MEASILDVKSKVLKELQWEYSRKVFTHVDDNYYGTQFRNIYIRFRIKIFTPEK